MRSIQDYEDILLERRLSSDVLWVSRRLHPQAAYIQEHKTSASQIKENVLKSYRVQHVINEISQEENISKEELFKKVKLILDEVGYNKQYPVVRWLGLLTTKVLKKLSSGILVNEGSILKVKTHMGKNPMLFIPSHRSYGDFILMAYICFHYEVDIPRVAAGMDFHSMMIMGRLLRDACAFFMRRSFTNDKLYATIFSEYVEKLITENDAAVEFFIEGTRSRTAKSLMPKFGFLSMALRPFFTGQVPDISVVPINFSYDRTLEEVLFAYELLGVPKPKESTSGLFKAMNILNENFGNVYVEFGSPISVREYFSKSVDRSLHNMGPIHLQDINEHESKQITHLAHTVVRMQQELTVITCFNLIAIYINNQLILGNVNLHLSEIVESVKWLQTSLTTLGALVNVRDDTEQHCIEAIYVHKRFLHLSPDGHVRLCHVHTNNNIDASRLKGYELSENTMTRSIPVVMLQHYVNPTIYFIINLAFLSALLVNTPNLYKDNLFDKFVFLRKIFSYEFVFHPGYEDDDFEKAVNQGVSLQTIEVDDGRYRAGPNTESTTLVTNIFLPFLSGYLAMVHTLNQSVEDFITESDLIKEAQGAVERMLAAGDINHPYSLSLDLLSNAIHSLASMGALLKVRRSEKTMFQRNKNNLQTIEKELGSLHNQLNVKCNVNTTSYLHTQLPSNL